MPTLSSSPAKITDLKVSVFKIPTDKPEADGTFEWRQTTMVLVEVSSGSTTGIGYTYSAAAAAELITGDLKQYVVGADALDVTAIWNKLLWAVRNLGRAGISSTAISAIDAALWDLKAKLLGMPLAKLLGQVRDSVPIYGSGGFTSYSNAELQQQLGSWAEQGIRMVKMKIGAHPEQDRDRIRAARAAIGDSVALFVDANGAYSPKEALTHAEGFAEYGVSWFEEPVSSDDLAGLHLLRQRLPAAMEVAAGEYGYDHYYFRRMLEAQAVDVLQADATRCGGITGFLHAAALADSFFIPLSAHTAPALHLHACCAAPGKLLHIEYFHDHVRIEQMLFEGVAAPTNGELRPQLDRPGMGLTLKKRDAERYAA